MPQIETDDTAEKPLDPAMERVRRKMVRTLAVSIGLFCVALMAVLGAIVYKISLRSPADGKAVSGAEARLAVPADGPLEARAALPAGFAVDHVALDGARILFYGRGTGGVAHAYVFDLGSGRIVADIAVGP